MKTNKSKTAVVLFSLFMVAFGHNVNASAGLPPLRPKKVVKISAWQSAALNAALNYKQRQNSLLKPVTPVKPVGLTPAATAVITPALLPKAPQASVGTTPQFNLYDNKTKRFSTLETTNAQKESYVDIQKLKEMFLTTDSTFLYTK